MFLKKLPADLLSDRPFCMQTDTNKDGQLSLNEMIENPYVFYSALFTEDDYGSHDELRQFLEGTWCSVSVFICFISLLLLIINELECLAVGGIQDL